MAIGNINLNANSLLGFERSPAETRRLEIDADNAARKSEAQANNPRQDFVLGASAYRKVLATLESDQTAATPVNARNAPTKLLPMTRTAKR